ncbi:MAG: YncE family protein [Acidobacteriaceae bacterium]|nr:YncE family protein [Acidobacteriaceae bacterium]
MAFPITPPSPNPAFSHVVVVLTDNGNNNPGASTTIDVSGDSATSQSTVGIKPSYAALVANGTRVFVANSADDSVSTFSPSSATPVNTISLPAGSVPTFVASSETATVYVSNSGMGTISAISTVNNVITNTIPIGGTPVAMAEMPNAQKLYVANGATAAANGSVVSINTVDKTVNQPVVASAAAPWVSPTWVVARSDSQRVYVLDKGSGFVSAIDTDFDTVAGTASVGIGADFMVYDPTLNRLYVTNPVANTVVAIDASNDSLPAISSPVSVPSPVSVTVVPNGTRAYVASAIVSGANVTSRVTVLNAADLTVKATIPLTSVPLVCATQTWSELSIAAAADNSRVYVGNCDARNTDVIQTSNDTLLLEIPAPFGGPFSPPTTQQPLQNPVLVVAGP